MNRKFKRTAFICTLMHIHNCTHASNVTKYKGWRNRK